MTTRCYYLHGPNGLIFSEQEKADLLVENLEKVHHQPEDFGNDENDSEVKLLYDNFVTEQVSVEDIKYASPSEVKKVIKSFKSKKAPGSYVQKHHIEKLATHGNCHTN